MGSGFRGEGSFYSECQVPLRDGQQAQRVREETGGKLAPMSHSPWAGEESPPGQASGQEIKTLTE